MKKIALIALMGSCFVAQAEENLKFSGTLISPPNCSINNGNIIEVQFGDVLINKIDGKNYMKDVPYQITCDSTVRDPSMTMTLTLTGKQASFSGIALSTNISALGIEIKLDEQPFTLNTAITVNEQSKPVLKAVPVKQGGAELKEGEFAATATLQVDYQ